MNFIHNSRLATCRTPYGAVVAGTTVELAVQAIDCDASRTSITLRTWIDGEGETLLPLEHRGGGRYTVSLPCPDPVLVWYRFIIDAPDGTRLYLGAPESATGGEGTVYGYADAPSFQITVYKHRAIRPTWYERGMVYQIFPDRYRRDAAWRERATAEVDVPRKGPGKRIVWDWNTPPAYDRASDGSIRTWDFYGGSLEGIREDLPRLQEMGITAIYLNPIFKAASNHRYDTGDYLTIDPMLGTKEDFERLAADAREHGISIILDGVFNHTGDDSLYFNRFGNYPTEGAWENEDSPWHDAFHFHEDGSYDAWWGIGNMPSLNEESPLVQDLILGENGVIRTWLRAGARGWRLDVADELTDDLIRNIKTALLEECPDGLLLGEVWEDASNKISYSKLRAYLQGDELDSAMNYPFRDMVLGFLLGGETAYQAAEHIETLRENYPPEALRCALNLLGSHDKPRIASVLGDGPDESRLPEFERGRFRLDENSIGRAKGRFWLATLLQMTLPGVPSIYYGDEFCLEGLSDPGNRRTLPEDADIHDRDMLTMIRNASGLRRALPFLIDGTLQASALNDDVLCIKRRSADGQIASVLINRSLSNTRVVRVPIENDTAVDLLNGDDLVREADGCAELKLWPMGSSVIYGHKRSRLQKPLEPGAGVIAHITSIPNKRGEAGTLGEPAKRFIDHLAAMGMRYWQVLPVNPTDSYGSPYAGPSAFAGNTNLLVESDSELRQSFAAFKNAGGLTSPEYLRFARENEQWLDSYCAYMTLKESHQGASRHCWPAEQQRYSIGMLSDERFAETAEFHAYAQFRFDQEWREMLDYAHERGILIIGDIPMYVSDDSADAWSEPGMFSLGKDGKPYEIAGVPPDRFSATGQVWGNPTYRWESMKQDGYVWWMARLRRSFKLYDYVRLDHFLGFQNYFGIPAGCSGAEGRWLPGPGIEFFEHAYREFGPLPFIAEDLGLLTPAVRALVASCGFPGMDVLEFADYDIRHQICPHNDKVLYTSTHDTSTLAGFVGRAFCSDNDDASARYLSGEILARSLGSNARVVMMQLQDAMLLGDDARMNKPGIAEGNWNWQADEEKLAAAERSVANLLHEAGRFHDASSTSEH
ncbi:4-alpha-glucanotransferase [Collinsella sp. D33t1_170424_A12]|uniref:4-alpha-glucanotransferase n=1 Tax=Collinsella sp. D33t1_170424_A12 TaxID=2787135 RepID=UPI001896E572|nr:4-alpha-glucanotransferase [Collinsella sp. D33t1_170424_A12]